jgi:hypothetical protein
VSAVSAWSQPSAPAPSAIQVVEMPPPPSPAVAKSIAPEQTISPPEPPVIVEKHTDTLTSVAPVPPSPAAHKVLNMGHWETGGGDDSDNIDFGFGFGAVDSDVPASSAPNAGPAAPKEAAVPPPAPSATVAGTLSPARPPPGLSIGGMPPMPVSAVMVHELENELENATLNAAPKNDPPPPPAMSSGLHNSVQHGGIGVGGHGHINSGLPSGIAQQNYNQYGMPSMYTYNAAAASASGFVGMHAPTGPVLASGVVPPQQSGKPQGGGLGGPNQNAGPPQTLPQQGLYGSQAHSGPASVGVGANADSTSTDNAGVPPGMPGAIPYTNPALHYGQHQFYMNQHQGGIGYNYGYGQFGGVAQGGFGYQHQQVMGQNQGYGAPHYDDQGHQGNTHHSSGTGGYQNKSGGGYRGRNTHHNNNNNQYQNQYNPQQHGGYGGQPYGMGYHGHGPAGMGDPYGMQHQGGIHSSGFQDDDHQKGRKGGRSGNSTLQQFQQGPQLGGQQQGFGIQGQGGVDSAPSSGGWSSNQGSGAGGWNGGAQSGWQGN